VNGSKTVLDGKAVEYQISRHPSFNPLIMLVELKERVLRTVISQIIVDAQSIAA
jgi:hypothetical protein